MVYRPSLGRPGGIYWYILQTHDAALVAYHRYEKMVKGVPGFVIDSNLTHKRFTLHNGATVFFKSGENFDDLRIETLDGAIIDEYRQQHPELWPMIIRPMLARRKGWADLYSTPNGFDHFKELWDQALLQPNEWSCFHAPSTEAWWWTQDEIESARNTMSEDEFAQEVLAQFREMGVGKVYKAHGEWNKFQQNPFTTNSGERWSPYLPIVVGLDFNVGLMCWELGQMANNKFHYVDEIAVKNTNTEECAPLLIAHVKDHKPGVILIGDASGNARKTSAAGATDYTIIEKALKLHGIRYRNLTPEANPPIKDRINCMNAALKAADGTTSFTYSNKCKRLQADLEKVKWKEGAAGAVFDTSDPELTHAGDAAGYPVTYYSNLLKQEVGGLRVIQR